MNRDSNPEIQRLASNQRRSRRVFLHIRVRLEWQPENKILVSEDAETIVVNAHGALIGLDSVPPLAQKVTLQNSSANQTQEAVVVFIGKTAAEDGKFNVAVEFTKPNASFWHINFPPEDWSPSYSDMKE